MPFYNRNRLSNPQHSRFPRGLAEIERHLAGNKKRAPTTAVPAKPRSAEYVALQEKVRKLEPEVEVLSQRVKKYQKIKRYQYLFEEAESVLQRLRKLMDELDEDEETKLKLADTYIALGDVSLETGS